MLSSSIWGSWQAQYGWALATTPSCAKRGTSSGWITWMCEMLTTVGPAVRLPSARDAVKGLADCPVADRTGSGKSGPVQERDDPPE